MNATEDEDPDPDPEANHDLEVDPEIGKSFFFQFYLFMQVNLN